MTRTTTRWAMTGALAVTALGIALVGRMAEAAPTGEIRGRRHTMLDDSDIHSTRHARALVGGVLSGVIGDTLLYVSGGAEHQGPPGRRFAASLSPRPRHAWLPSSPTESESAPTSSA